MPKKTRISDVYVRVDPDNWMYPDDPQKAAEMCRDIRDSILRHCDSVAGATVEMEHEHVCEFCGYAWTEDSDQFNGGCCDEDMEHDPDAAAREQAP